MRHALINHAQARLAEKRGGGGLHVTLSHVGELSVDSDEGMVALHETASPEVRDGRISVGRQPGHGVEIHPDLAKQFTVETRTTALGDL